MVFLNAKTYAKLFDFIMTLCDKNVINLFVFKLFQKNQIDKSNKL